MSTETSTAREFDWSELSNDELLNQHDIYWDIIEWHVNQLPEQDRKMFFQYLEIERELAVRELA